METTRRRRACVECFQRKVRCEWQEDLNICVRCQRNQFDCRTPSHSEAPLRNPVRDVLSALDKRLRGVETSASTSGLREASQRTDPAIEAFSDPSHTVSSNVSTLGRASHEPSLPWRMLASDTSTSPNRLSRIGSLADEELNLRVSSHHVSYNLLKDFPLLSQEDVIITARAFAFESPFAFMHWPNLKEDLHTLLEHEYAASASLLACMLMHLAFGSSLIEHVSRLYEPTVFFTKALNLLPQLVLEQSVLALKALTLIVHYLQASYHPTQCYTLLGAASNLAVGLGLHKPPNMVSHMSHIERQEGLRAWWLCYIMQRTMAIIYDMPMMDFSVASKSSLPELFQPQEAFLTAEEETLESRRNDEETVTLFLDVISVIQTRDSILADRNSPNSNSTPPLRTPLTDIFPPRRHFDTRESPVRSHVRELVRLNSIIVVDHRLHASCASAEAINAAMKTIQLIDASQREGLVMCLWMWLYYAFTATALLFSHLLRRPLGPDAALHLALISDIHGICAHFAGASPAALRIKIITEDMDRVGFKLIKSASKKRALEGADAATAGEEREKRSRIVVGAGAETRRDGGSRPATAEGPQASAESLNSAGVEDGALPEGLLEPPADFIWEDWEAWIQEASSHFNR